MYPVANGNYITGVDHDVAVEPAGVDIDKATEAYVPQDCAEPDYGLGHQDPIEPEHLITPPTDTPTIPYPGREDCVPKKRNDRYDC